MLRRSRRSDEETKLDDDPYFDLFEEVREGDRTLDSEAEWRRFLELGLERGLLTHADVSKRLKNVWRTISTEANAFGHARDARLTFSRFQELLLREYTEDSESMNEVYEILHRLPVSCRDAMAISSNKAKAMHKIDRMLQDLEESSKQVQRIAKKERKKIDFRSFFAQVNNNNTKTSISFSKFQETHASEIARQSSGLRLTPSRIRAATKSRRRVVDRFGLSLELDRTGLLYFAVLSLSSLNDKKEKKDEEEKEEKKKYVQIIVAAPVTSLKNKQRGISSEDWRLVLNAQEAHRQLSLSKHFPNALGMYHRTGIRAHTAFAYEYFRVVPMRHVLQRNTLEESSLTFRFWISQVLRALWDLHSQCSFQLVMTKDKYLSLDNIALRDPDLERVIMTNMRFESDMRDFDDDDDIDMDKLLEKRESFLVSSFENIIRDMLRVNSKRTKSILIDNDTKGIDVFEDEIFTLISPMSIVPVHMVSICIFEIRVLSEDSEEFPTLKILGGTKVWKCHEKSPEFLPRRSGTARIRLDLYLESDYVYESDKENLSEPISSLEIQVNVSACNLSDSLRSVLRACRASSHGRQATLQELRSHSYFRSFVDGEDVRVVGNEELLYELQEAWVKEDGKGYDEHSENDTSI
jgi:hypothetical protein